MGKNINPAMAALYGYVLYMLTGWIILCIPCMQKTDINSIDNLFTSVSAVSTTGLATVNVFQSYSFWGQLVILVLIQLGGIGYMTFGSFIILSRNSIVPDERLKIGKVVFCLPAEFRMDKFIKSVISFTLIIEIIGAILLYILFKKHGVTSALWNSIFHSISAFCTAGFSLFDNSMENFKIDFWINSVISLLSYFGAVGFIVCVDVWRKYKGKIKNITLTSKIILWATVLFTLIGTYLFFINEPGIQKLPTDSRIIVAFFQTMTAMTTVGFNSISFAELSKATLFITILLMIVGASPSGTGGGLKSTTLSAIYGVMKSSVKGQDKVYFWNKPIPLERIWTAVASLGFYIIVLIFGTYLLLVIEPYTFVELAFEAASALGTVGLSLGITANLTNLGKLIIILLMFCGRLGPLTFGIALFSSQEDEDERIPDIAI